MKERREFPEQDYLKTEPMVSARPLENKVIKIKNLHPALFGAFWGGIVLVVVMVFLLSPSRIQRLPHCQELANDLWRPLVRDGAIPLNGAVGPYKVITTHNTGIIDFLYPDNLGYECRLNNKEAWYIILNPTKGVTL